MSQVNNSQAGRFDQGGHFDQDGSIGRRDHSSRQGLSRRGFLKTTVAAAGAAALVGGAGTMSALAATDPFGDSDRADEG